jgi:hypothetical protein
MTSATVYSNAPDLSTDDYVVVGLSNAFIRDDGETHAVCVVEPIPSASLEALMKGIPTSYAVAYAISLGQMLQPDGNVTLLKDFSASVQVCDAFVERAIAAARTYKVRPVATQHIPLGSTFDGFTTSTERKRVLNSERIVKAEDNVKQHAYTHQRL